MNVHDLMASVSIATTAVVGVGCVLGSPREERVRRAQRGEPGVTSGEPVVVGEDCLIQNHVVIYEGTRLGRGCLVEDRGRLGYDCRIADGARVIYGAYVCDRVVVGSDAVVAGFVCDGVEIGDRSTVMGELVHEYSQPHRGWWDVDEPSPVIASDTVVGFGARVVGGVQVGPRSYVAAGAMVTKDVPEGRVVTGVNVQTPVSRWSGRRLAGLLEHWRLAAQGADGTRQRS